MARRVNAQICCLGHLVLIDTECDKFNTFATNYSHSHDDDGVTAFLLKRKATPTAVINNRQKLQIKLFVLVQMKFHKPKKKHKQYWNFFQFPTRSDTRQQEELKFTRKLPLLPNLISFTVTHSAQRTIWNIISAIHKFSWKCLFVSVTHMLFFTYPIHRRTHRRTFSMKISFYSSPKPFFEIIPRSFHQ